MQKQIKEFKLFSKYLSQKSAGVIKSYFRTQLHIDSKSDESPVTIADKKAEEVMRELIMKEYPDHGIIGEEFGKHNEDAEYQWILDPIDGTKSFICGALSFGTLIALTKNQSPLLGVINHPILDEFLIGDNVIAELNDKIVRVRECTNIENAVLLTTDHINIEKHQKMAGFEELIRRAKLYRHWGDCYGYYLLATGYADIMIDPIMSVWDSMALIPIIRGAKGVISDYQGNNPETGTSIVAAHPFIHKEIISLLNT